MKFHDVKTKSNFTFHKGSINKHLFIFYPIPRTVEMPRVTKLEQHSALYVTNVVTSQTLLCK